ncbi:MAG: metallophosphoesterase [Pseudobdellovibrionaceae bacterium]
MNLSFLRILQGILILTFGASSLAAEFAIIGDAGRVNNKSKMVRESILRQSVTQLILPGDNIYSSSSTYQGVWGPWQNAGMTFDVVALGNHNNGYSNEMNFFKMPSEYYSKVVENARFIVLNSDHNSAGPQQATWLERELTAATEPMIFLIYHHPTYTISRAHTWDERSKFQNAIRPVLWKYRPKITALIVGHDHLASLLHFNDLPVILSGAVQDVRKDKPVDNVQNEIRVKTAWYFDSTPHWAKLSWNQTGLAQVQFIRASNDLVTCTASLPTGAKALLHSDCR